MHPMKMNTEQINEALENLKHTLTSYKVASGTIQFVYSLSTDNDNKATLRITDEAWQKIKALVAACDKEIAWHGTVTKDGTTYTIEDIIVFPQSVTGSTVTSDETEYSMWLMQQPNEIFNKLRFHGHSHVNMGVSPSGVDLTYQQDIIKNLQDFYIFAIFNKKGSNWCAIYDVEDNIVYEDDDIILDTPEFQTDAWAKEQIEQFVAEPYKKPTATAKKKEAETEAETSSSLSYSEEFVNQYYDKTGKHISQEEKELNDQYRQRTLGDYYGYGGYFGYGQE